MQVVSLTETLKETHLIKVLYQMISDNKKPIRRYIKIKYDKKKYSDNRRDKIIFLASQMSYLKKCFKFSSWRE